MAYLRHTTKDRITYSILGGAYGDTLYKTLVKVPGGFVEKNVEEAPRTMRQHKEEIMLALEMAEYDRRKAQRTKWDDQAEGVFFD